jgi:hypothetical protein
MKVTCKTVTGASFDVAAEPSTSVRRRRCLGVWKGKKREIGVLIVAPPSARRSNPNTSLLSPPTHFFQQVSAVRTLIEAVRPELTADTLIVIHQGKVKRKDRRRTREESEREGSIQKQQPSLCAMGFGALDTLLNLDLFSLRSDPTPRQKQILKDEDTLGGVGFGDASFLVLMTKVNVF